MISGVPKVLTHLLVNWFYVPITRNKVLRYFKIAGLAQNVLTATY